MRPIVRQVAVDVHELGFRCGVTPADDPSQASRDESVRFGRAEQLAASGAILGLAPLLEVGIQALHAVAVGPRRIVGVGHEIEVMQHFVVELGRDASDVEARNRHRPEVVAHLCSRRNRRSADSARRSQESSESRAMRTDLPRAS